MVHEMTHLHEHGHGHGHGERLIMLLDVYLPTWRTRRDALNTTPLRDENWQNQLDSRLA
ncbi:hypothetical protein GCM10011374_34180 [Kocuria dechangensis]|uniref:Uncharacterized protein n=1 Tax=Kocuria dechangensis TaxID=1176249 RepID=A0A917LZ13_9MICC|nr:hypothetical protein GCM10011374_34180 [Kocuria dechangensis]